jgi:hypothetical protein
MKLKLLFEELLVEATPSEIYTKYYSKIPPATFIKVISADPQSAVNPGVDTSIEKRVQRIGKYSKLLLLLYGKGTLKLEDLDRAKDYLGYLYKHKIAVDINKVNQLSDLYDLVKKYIVQDKRDISTILKSLSEQEYKILHNGENWYIVQPLTERASCYLGVNTEWCTTWGPYSLNDKHKGKDNYFSRYNTQGPLFIMINKTNENDKYQFHFESKQFMNPADKQINTGDFLNENPEIKKYFFPSLFTNVTDQKQIDAQIKRMTVLSGEDSLELLKKSISEDATSNPIVYDLLNNNIDGLKEKIEHERLVDIQIGGGYVNFEVDSYRSYSTIGDVESVLAGYNGDINSSYDRIYDDLRDRFYNDDDVAIELEPLFKKYYEENSDKVKQGLGSFNYEQFKKDYFEIFYKSSKIQEEFLDQSTRLNQESFEAEAQKLINDIEKYIKIDNGYRNSNVELNIVYFVQYLVKNNITKMDGEGGSDLLNIIEDYITDNNVQTEYEYIYEYVGETAGWDKMEYDVEKFFEELIDDGEVTKECLEVRQKFNDVYSKIFKNKDFFENEHVIVKILSGVDCSEKSVEIHFQNKDTGKSYRGNVKVENLASYVTNYQLFESFIKFKKVIK